MVTVSITSQPGTPYRHELKARSHTIVADVPGNLKGGDAGPTPHELALMGLGACTAMTLEMYAANKKWDLQKVTVTVTEDSIDDPDQPGTKIPRITEDIQLEGNLTAAEITALEGIAAKCPVYKLFTGKKQVVTTASHTQNTAPQSATPVTP